MVSKLRKRLAQLKHEIGKLGDNRKVYDRILPLADRDLVYDSVLTGKTVAEPDVMETIGEGDVIVVRDLIGKLGLAGSVDQLSRDHFGVPAEQLEDVHLLKTVDEIIDSTKFGRRSDLSLQIQSSIIARILGPHAETYYIELDPNLRPHLPFGYVEKHEDQIEQQVGRGKMNPHGQHKDSWRHHPPMTLNIWVALTDTDVKNGMSILPKSQAYFPKYGEKEIHPSARTYISMQYVTDLKAGDAVVFLADLLHGSILNNSDKTRVAFSMRGSVEKPRFHQAHVYNYIGIDKGKYRSLFVDKVLGRNDWLPPSRDLSDPAMDEAFADLDIVRKSGSEFVVRVGDEERTFPRRCPHKGADLTLGGLDADGNLLCPWHRLCIKPKTVKVLDPA